MVEKYETFIKTLKRPQSKNFLALRLIAKNNELLELNIWNTVCE